MCYDANARPPDPPMERGKATGQDLVLTAGDGTKFATYLAAPEGAARAQILIYPDVRGLHQFYKELALRLAEVGVRAMAIDYFGRTIDHTTRDDSFEYMPHVQQLTLPTVFIDAAAAFAFLRQGSPLPMFAMGFCLGGSMSIYTGTRDFGLKGVIPFYAGLGRKPGNAGETPLEASVRVKVPLLGLFGGEDPAIPVELVAQLDEQLDRARIEHEVIIYPGAPHSFFDRRASQYANESADAWNHLIGFINAHS